MLVMLSSTAEDGEIEQTHLVCVVPPYRHHNITEAVSVRLMVVSSGKMSEAHTFTYTPITTQQQPAEFQGKAVWSRSVLSGGRQQVRPGCAR
uniref:Rel homology dimerisation domain-containing protein n=1 Tax=Timema monikensis TaxID=170555 RepID=A0A7R9EFH7_9NEOP|nr:unnamed protein product [Timema monikensis]